MHELIARLETLVDKLPKEANWFNNVDHIKATIEKMKKCTCVRLTGGCEVCKND